MNDQDRGLEYPRRHILAMALTSSAVARVLDLIMNIMEPSMVDVPQLQACCPE